jgi:hypothetical protein
MVAQRKVVFALESGEEHEVRWGLDLLVIRSHDAAIQLSSNTGLLSTIVDLALSSFELYTNLSNNSSGQATIGSIEAKKKHKYISRRVLTVLRNLAMTPPNDQVMAQHVKCVQLLVVYLSSHKKEFLRDALDTLSYISPYLVIAIQARDKADQISGDLGGKLLTKVLNLLANSIEENTAIRVLSDITRESRSLADIVLASGSLNTKFLSQVTLLLTSDSREVVQNTLNTLHNIAQYGPRTRELIAREPCILKVLISLLDLARQGDGDFEENASKAAVILGCLASEPENRDLFLPYEQYFVQVVLTESGLSDFAVDILAQLVNN